MRHDDPSTTPNPSPSRDPRPQARARSWAWTLALAALMALTSLAVASSVSAWLVPPYLVLMSLILFPTGRRDLAAVREGTGSGPGPIAGPVADGAEVASRPRASDDEGPAVAPPDDQAPGARARRGEDPARQEAEGGGRRRSNRPT